MTPNDKPRFRDLDPEARRPLLLLFGLQAFAGGQMVVWFAYSGLVGLSLAADKALATLPISLMLVAAACGAPAISLFMGRYGRRAGFLLGLVAGLLGGLCGFGAVIENSFVLQGIGAVFTGLYFSSQGFLRFAAIDAVPENFAPKAVSIVLIGGLIASLAGVEIAIRFEAASAVPYAGAYLAIAVLNLIGFGFAFGIRIPPPVAARQGGRSLFKDGMAPIAIIAIVIAMIFYAMMNLIMTSAPLAMHNLHFESAQIADTVRRHVFFMFAPSLIAGKLIARFGAIAVIAVGLALMIASQLIAVAGNSATHFHLAMILLGVSWNFGFISATTLLAQTHLPEGQSRVQGINDFCVLGLVTVASLSSGFLMHHAGWTFVNLGPAPLEAIAAGCLIWLYAIRGRLRNETRPVIAPA